jgi:nucleoside phosphorylase
LKGGGSVGIGVVCLNEMGMAAAAAVGTQLIEFFRPRLIAMLGMCCGFTVAESALPKKLLDIIIAKDTACWEEGKYTQIIDTTNGDEDGSFRSKAKSRPVDDAIREEVAAIVEREGETLSKVISAGLRGKNYKALVGKYDANVSSHPTVQYGTMVSGSSIVASNEQIKTIIKRHPAALGLDMELYGLYTAANLASGRKPSVIGIKGVCDFGDGNKADDAQELASTASAITFKHLLSHMSLWK